MIKKTIDQEEDFLIKVRSEIIILGTEDPSKKQVSKKLDLFLRDQMLDQEIRTKGRKQRRKESLLPDLRQRIMVCLYLDIQSKDAICDLIGEDKKQINNHFDKARDIINEDLAISDQAQHKALHDLDKVKSYFEFCVLPKLAEKVQARIDSI